MPKEPVGVSNNARGRFGPTLEQDGFRFDRGPTFFLFPEVLERIFELCGRCLRDEVALERLDPNYRLVFEQGGELDATCDLARLKAAIAAAVIGGWLAAAPSPSLAETVSYELDPEHTTVAFLVPHIGFAKVLGQFLEVEGSFRFDEAAGGLSDIDIVVETDSVTTLHEDRDRHLRSADFLDSDRFPRMRFTAARARPTGQAVARRCEVPVSRG